MKLAAARFRARLKSDERLILFDFIVPPKEETSAPDVNQKMKNNRKIDALQKKARKWKVKCDLLKRKYQELDKENQSIQKNSEEKLTKVSQTLSKLKYNSKKKTEKTASQRRTISAMPQALKKCVQSPMSTCLW